MKALMPLAALLMVSAAVAGKTVAVAPSNVDDVTELDEVIVTGDRTLSAARKAIVDAEDRFYARWNELNPDKLYDIKCFEYTRTGTHFKFRACQPRFFEESSLAESRRLMDVANLGNGTFQAGADVPLNLLFMAELKRRTLVMIEKDPELKRALLERARLAQYYEELRKEKFRHHFIVWD
jgi:hypothetical protein